MREIWRRSWEKIKNEHRTLMTLIVHQKQTSKSVYIKKITLTQKPERRLQLSFFMHRLCPVEFG